MRFSLSEAVPILERTPRTVRALLQFLPEAWTHRNYGSNPDGSATWAAHEIVAHLIFADQTDWLPRAKHILEFGDSRPFEPFDRHGHHSLMNGKPLHRLLDEFEQTRRESLSGLHALRLTDADLDRAGMHPALGAATMRNLLAMWVVHDLNHLAQMSKAMAYQYKSEVGPWEAYASILSPPAPR
ncbi:MAG: DinB family protein [Phycisphaeraceae bacterium]|nr:DinB family protein [Phycisphaeraceae bacterium]